MRMRKQTPTLKRRMLEVVQSRALAARNDRFYRMASIRWSGDEMNDLVPSLYHRLVDLLGVSIRVSYTQGVYIASREEAELVEKYFGTFYVPCTCREAQRRLSSESLLYHNPNSGIAVTEFYDAVDKTHVPRRFPDGPPKWLPRIPKEMQVNFDWGDPDPDASRAEPRLWHMVIDGEEMFRVWRVTQYLLETALLVLAEEPEWAERLQIFRDEKRRIFGVETMRKECKIPEDHDGRLE